MSKRFRRIFPGPLPVIAMAHVPALPGSPLYDAQAGIQGAIDDVRRDLEILVGEGVDAVLFCNENDRPYLLEAPPVARRGDGPHRRRARARRSAPSESTTCGTPARRWAWPSRPGPRSCARCSRASTRATWACGSRTRARSCASGRAYGADDLCILMNVTPEFASPLGSRPAGARARSAVVSSLADAILVSGAMAGARARARDGARDRRGRRRQRAGPAQHRRQGAPTIASFAPFIGGVIVGSDLKRDGDTWAPVERERVRRFLDAARSA